MKIAIVVVQFPPRWLAGTEIATYNIAKHLSRRGHEIHVITRRDHGLLKYDKKNGFNIHRVTFPDIRFFGAILFWVEILLCLKRIDPQIIHIQMIDMGIPGFLAKKFLNKNYIVYCRGSDVYFHWYLKKLISKLVLENASKIITLTEDMKAELGKHYNGDIFVIPNGIDIGKFEKFQTEVRISNNQKTILFVGTLRQVKGVKYLIEAMKIVIKNNPDTRLLIVGDGKERKKLETLCEDLNLGRHVTFVGSVSYENIPKYMMSSDIFVLSSLSEGFPNVILEAMASGLPIVCTNVGGMKEIIKDKENGFIVGTKNVNELSSRILILLRDDKLRKKISAKNLIKVKKYAWENVIENIEKIYEMVNSDSS